MVRKTCFMLLAAAVAAAALAPASASAFRRERHPDPRKAFAKKKWPRIAHAASVATWPTTWPCSPQTTDLPSLTNAPQVRVIYAYPTDVGNHFADYANLIQADAAAIRDRLASELNSEKSVRFDVGATGGSCTEQPSRHLDIQTVALSYNKDHYNSGSTFPTLTRELATKLAPPAPGARVNYLVYADQIQFPGAAGQADLLPYDVKRLTSPINQGDRGNGRLFALVYGDPAGGGSDFIGGGGTGSRREVFLHELSHTLGAVQDSAPHSSKAGHCVDEYDIMCYDDGGSGGPPFVQCGAGFDGDFSEAYDCQQDDYFNPSPPAGSYLAQKWNVYDSVYLCDASNFDCDNPLPPPSGASLALTRANGGLLLSGGVTSGTIANYEWDMDSDGVYDLDTGTTSSVPLSWSSAASPHTVTMRADRADGSFALASVEIRLTAPQPAFSVTGTFAPGQTLTLDATGTTDPDALITKFRWDLDGDQVYETDTGLDRIATVSFPTPRAARLGLEVEYPLGVTWTNQDVTIAGAAPRLTPAVPGPSLSAAKVRLARLISRGLPLVFKCGAPCTVMFTLSVNAKTAKKLHLKGRPRKPVVIGRLRGGYAAGTTRPSLQLTAAAKRALKRARSLSATLGGSVKQRPAATLKVSKVLSFKR
jgi:hypothetical protein